jgi:hypothetical protein
MCSVFHNSHPGICFGFFTFGFLGLFFISTGIVVTLTGDCDGSSCRIYNKIIGIVSIISGIFLMVCSMCQLHQACRNRRLIRELTNEEIMNNGIDDTESRQSDLGYSESTLFGVIDE